MGNGIGKIAVCFTGIQPHTISVVISDPLDEGLGHSFCYIRPDLSSSKVHCNETTTFRSISGASVSANTYTPLSTSFLDFHSYQYPYPDRSAAAFESSDSFASIPLQPVPRFFANSGPLSGTIADRGFMSGPIERGFLSGPIDPSIFSGPLAKGSDQFQRSFSHSSLAPRSKKGYLVRVFKKAGQPLRRAIAKTIARGRSSIVAPIKGVSTIDWGVGIERKNGQTVISTNPSSDLSFEDDCSFQSQNLQWAQGKAGEDRVHVVISEEHGWLFVGIYDGFNGPDAPDYLLSNLYSSVHKELKGLLWEEKGCCSYEPATDSQNGRIDDCYQCSGTENFENSDKKRGKGKNSKKKVRGTAKKLEENQRRWNCEWDRERLERVKQQLNRTGSERAVNHSEVLEALSRALRKTEEAYLETADKMVIENPELALMGSCVLVMLMKGEDVYLMNVGDSRGVLASKPESDKRGSLSNSYPIGEPVIDRDLERINDELLNLAAVQLTLDHSTSVEEEVLRIKSEHQDDPSAIVKDRVKGSLKVTRAFGAGFLKQPKWNTALLEMFRIDYIGNSPYITCNPSLYHHRLGPKDRFLILSSDGLYQYFTNEEAVAEVELFIASFPDGDPAQHLVEELLFRAAKKAGMDFHELLEIPQGDRRRYHDDVSIIVVSLEGRIWRSCV